MNAKLYLKICLLAVTCFLMAGLAIPYLVSQKSDLAVLFGFTLMLATPFGAFKAAQHIITRIIKGKAK